MPYIYSLAWKVSSNDYSMQRPLVMDWRTDVRTWNLGDQFMFGPDILVAPVHEPGVTYRNVYLPRAASWYDFWTGDAVAGIETFRRRHLLTGCPSTFARAPILPMGPETEYATQDPADLLNSGIYRGANGSFELYEDSGDSYDYEKGMHTIIPLHWNDQAGELTIGNREGAFPEMAATRQFRIVLVAKGHGVGEAVTSEPDRLITYDGKEMKEVIQR